MARAATSTPSASSRFHKQEKPGKFAGLFHFSLAASIRHCALFNAVPLAASTPRGVIIEASLGFLGVGIPPPNPTWGNMLSDALNSGLVPPWWLVLFPGLAITITVLAFNLLGDGIRDILDPRLRGAVR